MDTKRQFGLPYIVPEIGRPGDATRAERITFERTIEGGEGYNERWLQQLLQENPQLLPIQDIEPAYRPLVPVCMELPTSRGYLDNVFVTPNGNLVFAECKLWRNPEARRDVVAQVMDYIESVTAWSYAEFENAAKLAETALGNDLSEGLYSLVSAETELEEEEFIDAVARNLRQGRGLFFIVGDGIREEAETLTAHVQAHAGMHFELALVELAAFKLPAGGYFIQPRSIARTINIERGIVRVDDARIRIEPTQAEPTEARTSRRQSLSAEEFFERLRDVSPELPDRLKQFLDRIEPFRVKPEFLRSLILRWRASDGTPFNIGYITTEGDVWTDLICSRAEEWGVYQEAHNYLDRLAAAIGGEVRTIGSRPETSHVAFGGKAPNVMYLLDHQDQWVDAIQQFAADIDRKFQAAETEE